MTLETIEQKLSVEQAPAMSPDQMQARITQLEAQVKAGQTSRFPLKPQAQIDGTEKTVKELIGETIAMKEQFTMDNERLRRERDDMNFRSGIAKPDAGHFKDKDECTAFCGRNLWNRMTLAQRANGVYIRESEIQAIDPKHIFGRGSNSMAATDLMRNSPVLYSLVKERAKKLGLI